MSTAAPWIADPRWDRLTRLFGPDGLERLARASVIVFGLGGVGSYAAEGLVRSAIGRLVLVDFDAVCTSNANRQLHALEGAYGKAKAEELARRCELINPNARIVPRVIKYSDATSDELLADRPDYVVDAIDNFTAKTHLLATCLQARVPVVSSLGAAGKLDPTQVAVADLTDTHSDPMARQVRKQLRRKYGVGANGASTGIDAVFSPEPSIRVLRPQEVSADGRPVERTVVNGSACFVTSVFGMVCASVVVRRLVDG